MGVAVLMLSYQNPPLYNTRLIFPFFKNLIPDLGVFYVLFAVIVLACTTNAVNLTDGLDGLAISTFGVAAAAYTALAYVTGHAVLADYLLLVRFPPAGELTIFCGALVGASLGFLWYNCYPAEIFMGDVGSLALGGAIGTVAILIKQELLLPIVGGVWVLEALSVIIQVISFKTTGKRVFKMSPLHHHFELIGWSEPKVITRFLIMARALRPVQPHHVEAAVTAMAQGTFSVDGRQVVVVGAARSGLAAAELLRKRGARVTLSESRPSFAESAALEAAGVRVETGGHQAATLAEADLVVVSPGVPLEQPVFEAARARGVEIIGELEMAWRWLKGKVIAVTGTKGKSTTTTLIGRMLSAAGRHVLVGGNIGVPISAQVEESTDRHVARRRGEQLPARHYHDLPAVGGGVAQPQPTTTSIATRASGIRRRQGPHLRQPGAERLRGGQRRRPGGGDVQRSELRTRVWFSLSRQAERRLRGDNGWIGRKTPSAFERLVPVAAVRLPGSHMLGNVIAATAAANLAGAGAGPMEQAVRGFAGLEHVMEPAGDIGKVRFVNDSKATNVGAARKSIESYDSGVVAIIGGRYKSGDLGELKGAMAGRGRAVVAIGEAAPQVEAAMAGALPVVRAASMAEAVARAYDAAGRRGRGAAGAGVRELRLVQRLRGAWPQLQGGGGAKSEGRDG